MEEALVLSGRSSKEGRAAGYVYGDSITDRGITIPSGQLLCPRPISQNKGLHDLVTAGFDASSSGGTNNGGASVAYVIEAE